MSQLFASGGQSIGVSASSISPSNEYSGLSSFRMDWWILPTSVSLDFPCGSAGKESACNAGDLGSIPGLGRSPGERKGYPVQYSGLENSMDCVVHGVAKSRTQLSDFHFHFSIKNFFSVCKSMPPSLQADSLSTELPGKPYTYTSNNILVRR